MLWTAIKLGAMTLGGAAVLGVLVFGADLTSYVRSSCTSFSSSVKENIPVDFQLRRARDLLDESGPEMRKNVRLMAEQEVDIATLKSDIAGARESLNDEKVRVTKLRDDLSTTQPSFAFGDFTYNREQVTQELARRFTNYKQAELTLDQKEQLLQTREKALAAAIQAMDQARTQRAALESEIEALDGRNKLVQASAQGSDVQIDQSKLAQATKVINEVRRQLDISEHVLAQDAKFTQPMQIDTTDEKSLLMEVDAHLNGYPGALPAPSEALTDASHGIK
jgi:chromosome segregation ATPase